jgi:hypothetical protein
MVYREHQPCAALAPFVQCYWTLSQAGSESPPPSRVYPDGCMEIVFHFADPFSLISERGVASRQAHSLLAGQIWAPVTLQPAARADVLGIRFRPSGAAPFLRFPLHEAAGQIVALEDVWGRRARTWRDAIGGARDRIAVLERLLLECGPEQSPPLRTLGPRQFRRRFEAEVGISPKLFQRIRRFQHALAILGSVPFAEAAAICGYYDQSHLVRDFRQFTGDSPSHWLSGDAGMLVQSVAASAGV